MQFWWSQNKFLLLTRLSVLIFKHRRLPWHLVSVNDHLVFLQNVEENNMSAEWQLGILNKSYEKLSPCEKLSLFLSMLLDSVLLKATNLTSALLNFTNQ